MDGNSAGFKREGEPLEGKAEPVVPALAEEQQRQLDEALSRGELNRLPPNQPKGFLGEQGFNLSKADTFEPDLNTGISQENDGPVVWLGILLAYLLFFPLAFWLLWRSPIFSRRAKAIMSLVGAFGVIAVWVRVIR